MFNTGLFVIEVHKRPCLWNVKDSTHGDRQVKLRAWEQIAKVFNTCNDSYSHKNITVDVLQRKWKHLRDYYIREKKRTSKATNTEKCGSNSTGRKRNSPLLEMLQFLDGNRETDIVEVTIERNASEENFYSETNEDEDKSTPDYEDINPRSSKVQRVEQQTNENPLAEDKEDSSDQQYLASLLPIIKHMTKKEKFKFRTQMMNSTTQENSACSMDEEEKRQTPEARKRQRVTRKIEEIEVVNKVTKNTEERFKRDEFSIYGEYVANKLRNIRNTHARHTAEFHINGILYKAEMGEYDGASRDVSANRQANNSRESSNARIIESMMYEEDDSSDIIANVIKAEVLD